MNPDVEQVFRDRHGTPYTPDPTAVPADVAPSPTGGQRVARVTSSVVWDTLVIEIPKTADHAAWIRLSEWPNYSEVTYSGVQGSFPREVLDQALRDRWEPISRAREERGWPFVTIFEVWTLRRAVPITSKHAVDGGITNYRNLESWVPARAREVE